MKKLLILAISLIPTSLHAQTYTQLQWGINKAPSPYQFGANINGTWSNLGTVSSTGVWQIPATNISGIPSLAGNNTWTGFNTFNKAVSVNANPGVTFTPVGNALTTNAGLLSQGTTAATGTREYQASFGLVSNKGTGYGMGGAADKAVLYTGIECNTGSIACWSFNPLTTLNATVSNDFWSAFNTEADFNNLSGIDFGTYTGYLNVAQPCPQVGSTSTHCYVGNTLITGSGTNTIDFGLYVTGSLTNMQVTSGTLNTGVITLNWNMGAYNHAYTPGSQIQVFQSPGGPSTWDGVYTVTSSTPTSVTFSAPSATGAYPGNLFVNRYPNAADTQRGIVVENAIQEAFEDRSQANTSFAVYGNHIYGIDLNGASGLSGGAIRLKNGSTIVSTNATGSANLSLIGLNAANNMALGEAGISNIIAYSSNVIPGTDNTGSLGVLGTRWASIYGMSQFLGGNGSTGGSTKYYGSTSGDVTVKTAAAAGTSTVFQLPASNGTNAYALTTDGSGVTSWNILSVAGGGTGIFSGVSGGIPYFSSTSAMGSSAALAQYSLVVGGGAGNPPATIATGSAGQHLTSGGSGANPSWTTATFPSTATSAGTILRADGTNWAASTATYPNTTAAGTVLASSSANTITGTATPTLGVGGTTNGTLTLASTGGVSGEITLSPASATSAYTATLPANTGTIAELNIAQTFSTNQTISSTSTSALAVGANGTTNAAFNVDASTASSATGVNVKSAAAAGGVAISAISSGANENITIDGKGTGNVSLASVNTSSNIGLGTASPSYGVHIIKPNFPTFVLQDKTTDATVKYALMGFGHYTNAQPPAAFLGATSDSTDNIIIFGGGYSQMNAATQVQFYTAANNTTTTGTSRMSIGSTGVVSILSNVASTTTSTGSLVVTGGVGVSGAVYGGSTVSAATAHITTAAVPSTSNCGTGATVTTGSSNNGGQFTIGSGATACKLTFANAYANTAFCTVTPTAAPAAIGNVPYVSASSNTDFTVSGGTASTTYNYTCFGN